MLFQNHERAIVFMTAVMFLGLSLMACSVPPGVTVDSDDTPASSVESEDSQDAPQDVGNSGLSELVKGNNAFAFDLYQAFRNEDGNLFYSPYSISAALAMTYAGARNSTEEQMASVLHYTLPQDQLHPAFSYLEHRLTNQEADVKEQEEDFILRIANSIWGHDGYSFLPEYLDLIAGNYGADLRSVDFEDGNNREQARLAINEWISEQTEGKIEELIGNEMLTASTRLVLANAVYFKANWEDPFANATRNDEFYLLDGSAVTVPMMSRKGFANYFEGEGFQAIELPYKGERLQMIVLLPAEGRFDDIESALDNEFVKSLLRGFASEDIKLYLPRFEYEASLSLADTLAEMGMPDAFDKLQADFSGTAEIPPNLFISLIEHKAFVAVDETGTEAAAATGVVAEAASEPVVVEVNRPFIFFIRDSDSGTIVFVGRVINPTT
jgi:serpin B